MQGPGQWGTPMEATRTSPWVRQHTRAPTAVDRRTARDAASIVRDQHVQFGRRAAAAGGTSATPGKLGGPRGVHATRADVGQQTATAVKPQAVRNAQQQTSSDAQQQVVEHAPAQRYASVSCAAQISSQHGSTAVAPPGEVSSPQQSHLRICSACPPAPAERLESQQPLLNRSCIIASPSTQPSTYPSSRSTNSIELVLHGCRF